MSEQEGPFAWEDPGPEPVRRKYTPWVERLSPAMERPGEWARVFVAEDDDKAAGAVNNLRNHKLRTPPGTWEFTRRENRVYAKYVAPPEEQDDPKLGIR